MQFNISIFFIVNQHTLYRIYYFYYLNNIDFKKKRWPQKRPVPSMLCTHYSPVHACFMQGCSV